MNRAQAIRAVTIKDVRAISANLQVLLPMLIVPLVLGIVLPGGIIWAVLRFGAGSAEVRELLELLQRLPEGSVTAALARFDELTMQAAYFAANYLLAPFFLLIPLMAASTISADSFAGEKERGTLESLLFSPIGVSDLFIAKTLASFLPAVLLTWGTFILTFLTVNAVGWPWFGAMFFPTLNWLPLLLLVVPLIGLATILLNVFISARVSTFQAAYQLGGVVVLPVIGLLVGNVTGILLFSTPVIVITGLVLAVLNTVLLLVLRRHLDRARLFESQVR